MTFHSKAGTRVRQIRHLGHKIQGGTDSERVRAYLNLMPLASLLSLQSHFCFIRWVKVLMTQWPTQNYFPFLNTSDMCGDIFNKNWLVL